MTDESAPSNDTAGDWLTVRIALTAGVVAVILLLWSGWRWWSASPPEKASANPTRIGVLFAAHPVPPPASTEETGEAGETGNENETENEEVAAGADRPGLLVIALDGQGAARRSGVRVGDVWLTAAGQPLCDGVDPQAASDRVTLLRQAVGAGFALDVELLRGDELLTLTVRDDAPQSPPFPWRGPGPPRFLARDRGLMGAELVSIPPSRSDAPAGVIVGATVPGGPADQAGVQVGDRIVALARSGPSLGAIAAALAQPLDPRTWQDERRRGWGWNARGPGDRYWDGPNWTERGPGGPNRGERNRDEGPNDNGSDESSPDDDGPDDDGPDDDGPDDDGRDGDGRFQDDDRRERWRRAWEAANEEEDPLNEPTSATIAAPADWFDVARYVRPGETVRLELLRHGRPLTLEMPFVAEDELPQIRLRPPLSL